MPTGSYGKDSLGWQWQQIQQRLGEWWEWQIRHWFSEMPEITLFEGWDISSLEDILRGLLGLLLICLAIWIIWLIWQYVGRYLSLSSIQARNHLFKKAIKEREVAEWWQQSQKFRQQGDYYQACRCLYLGMLQRLHDSDTILHQTSRTDREYRLLLMGLPSPEPYETLLEIHQQLCFGNREASPVLLAECERAYEKIISTGRKA